MRSSGYIEPENTTAFMLESFNAFREKHDGMIMMRSEFNDESKTEYLDVEQRKAHLVTFRNGQLFKGNDPLDAGRYLYVMDQNFNIYAVPEEDGTPEEDKSHHSYLVAGEPVRAAGFFTVDHGGCISSISNESGHYSPNIFDMLRALNYFYQQINADDEMADVTYESHDDARQGIIKTYSLRDIIQNIKSPTDAPKLAKLVKSTEILDIASKQAVADVPQVPPVANVVAKPAPVIRALSYSNLPGSPGQDSNSPNSSPRLFSRFGALSASSGSPKNSPRLERRGQVESAHSSSSLSSQHP